MELTNINLITSQLKKEVQVRPEWIKPSKRGDEIWRTFKHLNNALMLLVQENYVSKKSIQTVINLFKINKEGICLDDDMTMLFLIYYIEVLDYIMDFCLKYELYESCHNIKIFKQLFNKL